LKEIGWEVEERWGKKDWVCRLRMGGRIRKITVGKLEEIVVRSLYVGIVGIKEKVEQRKWDREGVGRRRDSGRKLENKGWYRLVVGRRAEFFVGRWREVQKRVFN
jgi:hypothetical protein